MDDMTAALDSRSARKVIDSPVGRVARHIQTYVESGGAKARYGGRDLLLLTTIGRRSGQPRRTALIYGRDGPRYLVVASNGGSRRHPLWYLNLLADRHVDVQVGPEIFSATARPATAEERPRLWRLMVPILPAYEGMQRGTKREIPVVAIERIGAAALEGKGAEA